jgi:hypothetical protein
MALSAIYGCDFRGIVYMNGTLDEFLLIINHCEQRSRTTQEVRVECVKSRSKQTWIWR